MFAISNHFYHDSFSSQKGMEIRGRQSLGNLGLVFDLILCSRSQAKNVYRFDQTLSAEEGNVLDDDDTVGDDDRSGIVATLSLSSREEEDVLE